MPKKLLRRREGVNEENLKDASEKLAMQFEQHKEIIAQSQDGPNSGVISISGYRE